MSKGLSYTSFSEVDIQLAPRLAEANKRPKSV